MVSDILADNDALFLGSRLKRLGERMQAGAALVIADAGLTDVTPSHMPLLTALDAKSMTVGELVDAVGSSQPGVTRSIGQLVALGLVQTTPAADQRRRTVSLTAAGRAAMTRARLLVTPRIEQAVRRLCAELSGGLLEQIAGLEAALADQSLADFAAQAAPGALSIREFNDELAGAFHDINAEWITAMFRLEPTDRDVLENPRERIVDPGGAILFIEAEGLGIVGTCALQKTGATSFELTKMAVRESARGLKAGEALLRATIDRGVAMGAAPLYLLTSKKCTAAIHLYEKAGFRHDAEIMTTYGARYARCDVAMRYRP